MDKDIKTENITQIEFFQDIQANYGTIQQGLNGSAQKPAGTHDAD